MAINNLQPPQSPFVDTSTGVLSNDGYQFLIGLLNAINGTIATSTVSTGLTARGTNQATALQLSSQWNEVSSAVLGSGVLLSAYQEGQSQVVFNDSGISISVYPPPGAEIDGHGVNNPFVLANATRATFDFFTSTQIRS